MNIIINDNKYRVIKTAIAKKIDIGYGEYIYYVHNYKVQLKVLFFWITIKAFIKGIYDEDADFCKREAVELYNKIVNPYGIF